FQIIAKKFGEVDNLFAYHQHNQHENKGKNLLFVGHTDVVATGELEKWSHPPFAATIENNTLYGRGAADMKSAVAAFTLAMLDFVEEYPQHKGKVAMMLTSDEEGVAVDGIKKMMPYIAEKHQFDYCLVGEPSSSEKLGDVVRIGRRGSLHVTITIHGKQGHVAFAENAKNPVFMAAKFMDDLSKQIWDTGNADFPPTSFQISSLKTSTNVANIIPADLIIQANFRYSPESTAESLEQQLQQLLKQHKLEYSLAWNLSGLPFHSTNLRLKKVIAENIFKITGQNPIFNAAGGTSDGRFVAPFGVDVVELGVSNKTIHQINECVLVQDVINLYKIYKQIIIDLLEVAK
ncbi:MAG TPA: succinyl-diaminopimelate desuccinylase, partial [Oceanospirillales bacterium]|nr:succinyl-diaminopimelate desuccinylase [Oceanospirillales bacterium]